MEIWKDIKGTDRPYVISNLGVVKRLEFTITRANGRKQKNRESILKQRLMGDGYKTVNLRVGGKQKPCGVHRLLASAFIGNVSGLQVDHIDQDKQNNDIDNLRICTSSQNNMNKTKRLPNASSKFKGVSRTGREKSWRASIKVKGRLIRLGSFADEVKAAHIYNEAARLHHGEYASLNDLNDHRH